MDLTKKKMFLRERAMLVFVVVCFGFFLTFMSRAGCPHALSADDPQ